MVNLLYVAAILAAAGLLIAGIAVALSAGSMRKTLQELSDSMRETAVGIERLKSDMSEMRKKQAEIALRLSQDAEEAALLNGRSAKRQMEDYPPLTAPKDEPAAGDFPRAAAQEPLIRMGRIIFGLLSRVTRQQP